MSASEIIHATSVAIDGYGLLLMGPSGSGKSDLALRLIDRGATLISDDYTIVSPRAYDLILSAPANIARKLEIRHLGIVDMAHVDNVPALLAITLEDDPERMPDLDRIILLAGVELPLIAMAGREASAPIKAELALRALVRGMQ